jgi:hypothetical protein
VVASVTNSDGTLPEECVLCSKIKVFMFFVQSESCKNEIKVAEVEVKAAEVKSKLSNQNFYFCPVTTVIQLSGQYSISETAI